MGEKKSDSEPKAANSSDIDPEDSRLFRRAIADARPLSRDRIDPIPRKVPARARFTQKDERAALEESLNPSSAELEEASGDVLHYRGPSVGARTFRKLSRGKFSVQGEIDLHGLTLPEARDALRDYIDLARARDWTCVRVIHGKGLGSGERGPVIKPHVSAWLRRWNEVLAFASARREDGGTGAVYVLLKRGG